MLNREQLLQSLASVGVTGTLKVFTDDNRGTANLLEAGFVRRVSSTGKKQYITTLSDGKEIIINVGDFKDNDTYQIIKRTANIDYKTMKAGQYFIIGL